MISPARVAALAVLGLAPVSRAQEPADEAPAPVSEEDARLAGYVEALLERELAWPRDSFRVRVIGGVVTVTVAREDEAGREEQLRRLALPVGAAALEVELSDDLASATRRPGSRGFFDELLSLSEQELNYPLGDVFVPLLADPKTPQFYASLRWYDTPGRDTTVGAVGFGETFGLWRRTGVRDGDGLQLGIAAGLFAQFDLETESANLVNADYTVGLPLTWRRGETSARLRLYHQSSHLGDEFVLETAPERVNLSFESLELLVSRDLGRARGYLGGEWLFHRDPGDLDPFGLHAGLEWRGERPLWGLGRPIAGLDVKSWQEHGWDLDAALSFGVERGSERPGRRRVRWMIDLYNGHAPHGQFYEDEIWYAGLGLYLGF